ncbi:MAG: FKBP-type peptidyl-prolyl cis-trans isomerase [Flavisolibacter sp.]|jgi:FKBP-type peptidyl-prolyl cis-trans isomerase FkpA|nr:FKBP-type peptidyl-prolyl cis-trans isomerase [Flavisolibacter sp.]
MLKNFLAIMIMAIFFSGCAKSGDGFKCLYEPCEYVAPASEIAAVQGYLTANSITATQHCSGLFYTISEPGTGQSPTACHAVNVTYEGRLTNGNVFDANTISINLSQVIAGWANGVPLIKQGGKIRLFIPPSLGYGPTAQPGIPANSILIFDVELH